MLFNNCYCYVIYTDLISLFLQNLRTPPRQPLVPKHRAVMKANQFISYVNVDALTPISLTSMMT